MPFRTYWGVAVKAAWDAFAVQHRIWSTTAAIIGLVVGTVIAKTHPTFAAAWLIASTAGVPLLLFFFQLLFKIPAKLWNEAE